MNAQLRPRRLARMTGLFFLLTILAGIFAQGFVSERLIVFSDAAATATNILGHKGLFQFGFTVYLIEMACQIVTAALFYQLLQPVNRTVALLFLVLELTGCIVKTFARVFFISSLFTLGGSQALNAFTPQQLQTISLILLRVNDYGAATALAFFGFSTILNGWLIFRSTFLPSWLGALVMISGLGWLTFLYPPLGYHAFMIAALVGLVSAITVIMWLFIFGVDEEKWQATLARA